MTSAEVAIRQPAGVAERDVVDGWIGVASDVSKLADYIAETDFVPKALRNRPAAIAACILTGRELGIGPMASLKSIHMVQGVPSLSAEYKRARALAAGHQIVIDESNTTRCVVRGRRNGTETWLTITWTADQARRAKLDGKDVWKQYPQRMLQARATSELCDLLFPDATLGLPTTEELEDGGPAGEVVAGAIDGGQAPAAIEPPKPAGARTARRRTTPAAAAPDGKPASGPAAAAGPAKPAAASTAPDLPPLPGEEEPPDPTPPAAPAATSPGTASSTAPAAGARSDTPGDDRHRKLTGIVHQHFKRLGFSDEDKPERLWAAGKIAGVADLASLSDLDPDELSAVADTLARCRGRKRLEEILAAAGELGGGDD